MVFWEHVFWALELPWFYYIAVHLIKYLLRAIHHAILVCVHVHIWNHLCLFSGSYSIHIPAPICITIHIHICSVLLLIFVLHELIAIAVVGLHIRNELLFFLFLFIFFFLLFPIILLKTLRAMMIMIMVIIMIMVLLIVSIEHWFPSLLHSAQSILQFIFSLHHWSHSFSVLEHIRIANQTRIARNPTFKRLTYLMLVVIGVHILSRSY